MPDLDACHVFVCGRTRSGKTRAELARALSHPGPVLFINTQDETMGAGWVLAGPHDRVSSLLRALRAGRRVAFLPAAYPPTAVRELQALVAVLFGAAPWPRPVLLIVDEAHVFAPQGSPPGALHRVALRGLRWGLQLVLISPRPAIVDKGLVTQCALHRIFATSWEGSYFASHGVPAEKVKAILDAAGRWSYVVFDGASVAGPFRENISYPLQDP